MNKDIVTKQLFEVVKNNKPDEVANVLKNPNCDVKSFRHGRTALHYAAMRGELVIIEQLISAGADVNAKSEKDFNESIVHCAAVHSSPLKVFNLLEKAGATFLVQDSEGANPLHLLVGFDSVFNKYAKATNWETIKPAIEFLVKKGLDPAEKGCSSATSAIEAANLSKKLSENVKREVVEFMRQVSSSFEAKWLQSKLPKAKEPKEQIFQIVQQSDPLPILQTFLRDHDISQSVNEKLENPLHCLFRPESNCNKIKKIGETLGLLLNADVSPSDKNLWGRTTIDYIQHYSQIGDEMKKQIIEQLIRDKELGEKLLQAAAKNDTKQLRVLLDRKSRTGTARANYHKNGRRAIHLIALNGTATSLELLLSKGARPDRVAFGDYSETPVHCACINSKPRVMLEALERYGANMKVLDAAGNSALDILVGGETCFEMETKCLEKEDLLQAIEFLMENGVAPKDDLVIDKEERMSRETREHVKELINRRKSQQWMARIDSEIKEIRDTRSTIQTKLLTIEAVLEEHNFDFASPAANSTPKKPSQNGQSHAPSIGAQQLREEIQAQIEKVREELKSKSGENQPAKIDNDDFNQLLLKTETAKIDNFNAIEEIKEKLISEVRTLREDLFSCQRGLEEERERLDEEKMSRLELEGEISELKRQVKNGIIPANETNKKNESGLENVGEDSALEEVLPQLDELQEKLIMLEDKVQHVTQFGATDAPLDAIIELTAKLKQEFQEFKSESDEIKHVLEKIKNNSSSVELRVSTLEESDKSKQAVLDRIVGIVEKNEAQCESQSSKLQLLEDTIRKTREEMSSSAGSAQNIEAGNSSMISDPETMKKLEERIDQVKSISCSLIEASSEKASDELMTVQENLHEMIMAVEEKVMDASFNASQAAQQLQSDTMSLGGGVSSELLNQQLAEVRVDKDMIIQRLNVAETARFELQKGVDAMRERVAQHKDQNEAIFENQKQEIGELKIEFEGFREHENTKHQVAEEKEAKIDEQLKKLNSESAKLHSEICEAAEKDENTKKSILKLNEKVESIDDEVVKLADDRNHNVASLEALRSSILELEKLMSEQMATDIEHSQKTEMKLSELIQFQQFAAPNLELLSENREKTEIVIESIQASVKALTDAVNNDSQVDTISAAVLELSDKLAKQGERIVGQDKTIAVAEHRIKQTSAEIDEKTEKYSSVIEDVKNSSNRLLEEIAEIRANLESSEDSQKEMLDEYAAKLQGEIQASKDFLVKKQNTETKEIAKQIFKMDKDFKSAAEIGKTNEESIANLRGKVELVKDSEDNFKKNLVFVEEKLASNNARMNQLENSISSLKSQLNAQQSAALDGESIAQQVAQERDRIAAELERAQKEAAELVSEREATKRTIKAIEAKIESQNKKMEKIDSFVSESKVQKIVGDGLTDVHDILDDAIGRLNKLEEEKSESDEAILKEAEKASKMAENLIQREESSKSELENKIKKLSNEIESVQSKLQKDVEMLIESKSKTQRSLEDLKFELEQKMIELKESQNAQQNQTGISLKDELGGVGGKTDIVKQVENAEKLAKIEAELIRLKGELQLANTKTQQASQRSTSFENELSELLVAKDRTTMKINAAETETIELRGKFEALERINQSQSSKIERLEKQLKATNEDLTSVVATLEEKTLQLNREKRENEANVNYMERMKIDLEMKMEAREDELRRAFFGEIQKALLEHDTSQGERLVQIERQLERQNSEFMMVQQMNDANNMQHEEARRQAMKAVKVKLDEIQRKTRGQMAVVNELALGVQELQELQERNVRGGLSHKLGDAVAGLFSSDRPGSPTGSVRSTSTTATWWRR